MSNGNGTRRFQRSRHERMIAGVCGGIAEFASVDTNLVRLVFVVLCFFGGAGLVIYACGWALMPEPEQNTSVAKRMMDKYTRQ